MQIQIDHSFLMKAVTYLGRIADGVEFTENDQWGARGLKDRLYAEVQRQMYAETPQPPPSAAARRSDG